MPDRRNLNVEAEVINQIINADGTMNNVVRMFSESGTSFPVSPAPVEKQLFYRTDLTELYIYIGGTWTAVSAGGGGVTSLDSITGAVTLVGAGGITITDNSPSAGDITISDASPTSGSGTAMSPLTITGQSFTNHEYILTGAARFVADQSFVSQPGKSLVIKSHMRFGRVGGGGGAGFEIKATVGGTTYQYGVNTLNSPALYEVIAGTTYVGGPTFGASSSGSRQFVEVAWHFSQVASAFNQAPFVTLRFLRDGGSFITGWEPASTLAASWVGATWSIAFYVDDNATSSVEYKAPLFSNRFDGQWI